MKPTKITTRTQVYRAIYYSSFNWERNRSEVGDVYTLKSKVDDFTCTLTHSPSGNLSDVITVKSSMKPGDKDAQRLTRLFNKILRRTKNVKIEQDLVEFTRQETNPEVK